MPAAHGRRRKIQRCVPPRFRAETTDRRNGEIESTIPHVIVMDGVLRMIRCGHLAEENPPLFIMS